MASIAYRTGRLARLARPAMRPSTFTQTRTVRTSTIQQQQDKKDDLMDKDSMNIQPTEHSKSGGDQQAAQQDEAFNPDTTRPETQSAREEEKSGPGNPSEVSPGNPEVSKPRAAQEGGAERSPAEASGSRRQSSGGGSAKKNG